MVLNLNWRKCVFVFLLSILIIVCALVLCGVLLSDKTTAGLILNVIGSVIIAVFGIPQPDFSSVILLRLSLPDEEKELSRSQDVRKLWHMLCSYLGIAYLMIGFILQLLQCSHAGDCM